MTSAWVSGWAISSRRSSNSPCLSSANRASSPQRILASISLPLVHDIAPHAATARWHLCDERVKIRRSFRQDCSRLNCCDNPPMSEAASSPRILTTTVGSYPIPDWLAALPSEQARLDATRVVFGIQRQARIDLPTDGELYRFDVNHPETNGMIDYFIRQIGRAHV